MMWEGGTESKASRSSSRCLRRSKSSVVGGVLLRLMVFVVVVVVVMIVVVVGVGSGGCLCWFQVSEL